MSKKVYVGNLLYTIDDQQLAVAFAKVGKVMSAKVVMDAERGRSRGFGFVEMSTDEEGQRAMASMNGQMVEGRPLVVRAAKDPVGGQKSGLAGRNPRSQRKRVRTA